MRNVYFDERVRSLGIVATPGTLFGEPRIDGRHIPVDMLNVRFQAGESLAELAQDYDLTVLQVENAVRFRLLPRRKRRDWQTRQLFGCSTGLKDGAQENHRRVLR